MTDYEENWGQVLKCSVPSEGQSILTGESPVMVKARAMQLGWQEIMETLSSEAHRQSPQRGG
jgi:hypothetical protein